MGIVKDAVSKIKAKVQEAVYANEFDVSSKEAREMQAQKDYEQAKMNRANQVILWRQMEDYYNGDHYTREQLIKLIEENGWDFTPPSLTDPYIQVESQIDVLIPQFQFRGRDSMLDPQRAKIREQVTKYVTYINHLPDLNIENERRLNKLGDAFWKVAFDKSVQGPGFIGEIVIGNPLASNVFPDHAAYDIDDCEYVIYSYRIHRRKARRLYGKVVDTIGSDGNHEDTEIFNTNVDPNDDTMQVVEYWYRDDEGDIACSVQVNWNEVQYIPKYWANTRKSGNKMYPFIHYRKVPKEQSFWGRGEIETIRDLVDAADREFFTAIMNDMFMASDIILEEDGAVKEGYEFNNVPGSRVKVNPGKINSVRRLGGVSANGNLIGMIDKIHDKILETNGNFSVRGEEPVRVTTASGLAQVREDRDNRQVQKNADRKQGFQRLYELIDWTVLEFYNTDRLLMIEPDKSQNGERQPLTFNSQQMQVPDPMMSMQTGSPYYYFPRIDVEITVGDGIQNSKAFTLAATQELAKTPITPTNIGIVKSIIDILDLPNKNELKASVDQAGQMIQAQQQMQMQAQQQQIQGQQMAMQGQQPQGQPQAEVDLPPEIQQLEQVMQKAGLSEAEQETFLQLLQKQSPEQQQEFLTASPQEQIQVINALLGQ
jgi:hypothetical protein